MFDAYAHVPNVACFREQAEGLVTLVQDAPLTESQTKDDLDFQQSLAQVFSLVPYGQLILEQAQLTGVPDATVDLVFATLVRDFSTGALDLHGKASSTEAQQAWVVDHLRKPVSDGARDEDAYAQVRALAGAYVMPD